MRSRFVSVGAAVALALVSTLTVLPGTALMASVTHPLFDNADFSSEFTYDDTTLVVQSIHTINRINSPVTIEMTRNTDNFVLGSHTFPANSDQTFSVAPLNIHITINAKGKPDGVSFRTV